MNKKSVGKEIRKMKYKNTQQRRAHTKNVSVRFSVRYFLVDTFTFIVTPARNIRPANKKKQNAHMTVLVETSGFSRRFSIFIVKNTDEQILAKWPPGQAPFAKQIEYFAALHHNRTQGFLVRVRPVCMKC